MNHHANQKLDFQLNNNEDLAFPILWNAVKEVFRRKCIALNKCV